MRMLLLTLTAAALAACSEDRSDPIRYACDLSQVASHRTCTEFGPLDDYGVSYNAWYCGQWGGTWGLGLECPTANLVASCQMPPAQGGSLQFWYVGATDLAGAQSQCTTYGGAWTAYP